MSTSINLKLEKSKLGTVVEAFTTSKSDLEEKKLLNIYFYF